MIDADEDQDRAANELAEVRQERRAERARLAAGGKRTNMRGTLSALPSAPKPAQPSAPVEATALVVAEAHGATDGAPVSSMPSTLMQFAVAAALVAVLIAVWVVERRSAARDREDGDVR